MKIGLCGTMSVGKTTLVNALKEDLDFKKPGIGIRADKIMKVIGKILKKNIWLMRNFLK